ncbi:MAG: hypothetical protein JSS57_00535 [Proteobacteria bacterium]|nr:hypothetical protein [Pseudomonadota bacterium]
MVARSARTAVGASPAGPSRPAGVNPLIRQLSLQQLIERDAEKPPETQDFPEDSWTALASHVRKAWMRNKLSKQRIDLKLLDCLRARRGLYSPNALADLQNNGGLNIVWADLTETKCKAASAWIREIVLPVGEQPWGIDATPVPDLPLDMKRQVVAKALEQAQQVMVQASQSGGGVMDQQEFRDLAKQLGDKLRDDAEKTYVKMAQARAKRMERQIADRLDEGGYVEAMDAFIEDFCTYPAAIVKGPIYTRRKELKWGAGWKPEVANNPIQTWSRVAPFDAYPAPGARSPQQGDFIERIRFRRDELFDLKGLPGYQDEQIDGALKDYVHGHLEGWLWTEAERQRLEQETLYMWLSPEGVIDALSYWGNVPGWMLMSYGVSGLEEFKEYECNVVICGRYVLYAALNTNPLGQRPYRKACYDEVPGAFWGRSIPDLAATSQKMCNGIACALADNLSIASGPMAWVHMDRLADGEQSMQMFPWKVWQLKSDPTQGVNPGVGFFQPDDRSANLMATYEKWELRADDATGIPRYTYGNENIGGAGDTASGLSMLMNSAAKGLRRAISNIDLNVISPIVNDTFTNEMLYNPDESIKGDCVVVPRGAAAILIRESAQQRRIQFLGLTANPIDAPILGTKYRAALLRQVAEALELPVDEVVPSDEELDQQMQQQAQQQQQMLEMQQKAEQDKMVLQNKLDMEKEQQIAGREAQGKQTDLISTVVQKAVETALQSQDATVKKTGAAKKLKYQYNDQGELVGGEVE